MVYAQKTFVSIKFYDEYSRLCPANAKRQPVILTDAEKEYIDERGKISNYELPESINLIGYIESRKGTVRANHYHPIQEQKCLLITGKYISVVKDLANPKAPIKTQIIRPGDMAIIKPNVAAMKR